MGAATARRTRLTRHDARAFDSYRSCLDWLFSRHRLVMKTGLERVERLLDVAGHPERSVPHRSRRGDEREGLHLLDDRPRARRAWAPRRALHVAASRRLRRAHHRERGADPAPERRGPHRASQGRRRRGRGDVLRDRDGRGRPLLRRAGRGHRRGGGRARRQARRHERPGFDALGDHADRAGPHRRARERPRLHRGGEGRDHPAGRNRRLRRRGSGPRRHQGRRGREKGALHRHGGGVRPQRSARRGERKQLRLRVRREALRVARALDARASPGRKRPERAGRRARACRAGRSRALRARPPPGARRGGHAGPAPDHRPAPDRRHRRGPQSRRRGGAGRRPRGGVRLRPAHRRPSGSWPTRTRGATSRPSRM